MDSSLTRPAPALLVSVAALIALAVPATSDANPLCHVEDGVPVPDAVVEAVREDPDRFRARTGWLEKTRRARENRQAIAEGRMRAGAGVVTATGGVLKLPLLLTTFDGHTSGPYPRADYEALLFGLTGGDNTLTDYFDEVSYGQLTVEGTVFPWVPVASPSATYTMGLGGIDSPFFGFFLNEVYVNRDATIDFGDFDNDGPDGIPNSGDDDGVVDCVVIVHENTAGSCGNLMNIWPHRGWYSYTTNDASASGGNIRLSDYVVVSGVKCGGAMMGLGTLAHEIGHCLGAPDLYDVVKQPNAGSCKADSSSGIGTWGVMGFDTEPPQHPTAWTKALFGWSTPTVVVTDLIDVPLASHSLYPGAAYKLWSGGTPALEYFLVEIRTQDGFDANLPGAGVLIYHVDELQFIHEASQENGDECHPMIDVECADQTTLGHGQDHDDLAANRPADTGDLWLTGDSFDNTSSPLPESYGGEMTDVGVHVTVFDDSTDTFMVTLRVGVSGSNVDLCIRDYPGDACAENTKGQRWWTSPDIWIDNNGDGVEDAPDFGATNLFHIRVRNNGSDSPSGVDVSLYHGDPGIGALVAGNMILLGSTKISQIGGLSEQVAVLKVDLAVPSQGDFCYAAVASHPADFVNLATYPYEDNNIAVRNIQEFPLQSGTTPLGAPASFVDQRDMIVINNTVVSCSLEIYTDPPPITHVPAHWAYDYSPSAFRLGPGGKDTVSVYVSSLTPADRDSVVLSLKADCLELGEAIGGDVMKWFIDDTPPLPPAPGAAHLYVRNQSDLGFGRNAVLLEWQHSGNDISGQPEQVKRWEVHRAPVPSFVPGPLSLETTVREDEMPDDAGWHVFLDAPPGTTWFYKVLAIDWAGNVSAPSLAIPLLVLPPPPPTSAPEIVPGAGAGVFPNPASERTWIAFDVARPGRVRVDIHDLRGRLVRSLVGNFAGTRGRVVWDHLDSRGRPVVDGTYFARITSGSGRETRKITVLR